MKTSTSKKFHKYLKEDGVSLIELMVIISILIIISSIALMNIRSSKKEMTRQNVARELKSAFERARFDSVKRRAFGGNVANVVISSSSFKLYTDINQNGTIAEGEFQLNTSWPSDITIRRQDGASLTSDITVSFNNRGEMTTSSGPAAFLVCNGDCSTPNVSNSNLILVTQTGTVNILPGGNSVPTFATPNVTNISSSNSINPYVRVN